MTRAAWLLLVPVLLAGCLFRNAAGPRFFVPASAAIAGGDPLTPPGTGAAVRLRAVHGIPFLRERIVWRVSPVESGQYEQRLWRELPESYVERALAATLSRTPGLRLTDDARAPALGVEVLAFDEVLAPAHTATVTLAASLRDERRGWLLERTVTAEAPIAGNDPAVMATAMGRALDEAAAEVAAAVRAVVGAR